MVYYPVAADTKQQFANGTVEEIVYRLLQEKQNLAQNVMVPSDKLNIEQELYEQIYNE
ncbi:hypothetical protein [Shimazuella alba]|uniref:Uncharacterized protein n=1 Tax=Shimazuella alba TaxID=2690964 RepID=A0A6I4VVZ1_9BACL|nr:hypothetical protein [Shimazuella alba]MXQ54778.1 hypothetical protein [Shimazuella alba]